MRARPARIVGTDIARGLALIGMFVAHAIPRADEADLFVDGRSSILFATLAGVSLGLMTGGDRPSPSVDRVTLRRRIIMRAAVLFLIGAVLTLLDSEIAIILDYYGVMFLLLVPVLFAPRRVLAPLMVVVAFAAPAIAAVLPDAASENVIVGALQTYLFTGYYPAVIWTAYLIAGLIAARSGLDRPKTQALMAIGGLAAMVVGYGAAAVLPGVSAESHSDSTAEVIGSGGVAMVVIAALLWLTTTRHTATGPLVGRILWPIGAIGSMSLTVYTLQIIVLAVARSVRDDSGAIDYPGWPLLIGLLLGSVVFASVWRLTLGRGPLERAMSLITSSGRPIEQR